MTILIALVDDHSIVGAGVRHLLSQVSDIELVEVVRSVRDLPFDRQQLDVVLLDLRLADRSSIRDNVRHITKAGVPVLAYTGADEAELIREAARENIAGVVRKSDSFETLVDSIRRAASGEAAPSTDWASAIDADPQGHVALSPREREVLALYASGETAPSIATLTGLSPNTIAKYVARIRVKYALAGRTAESKIDLHQRATEDGVLPRR